MAGTATGRPQAATEQPTWRASLRVSVLVCCVFVFGGCDEGQATAVQVEKLPDIQPNLPEVPKLPPPEHPVKYEDGSYSIYGLRKRMSSLLDKEVRVAAYINGIYAAPECPPDETCPKPAAPHIWLTDAAGEQDPEKRLTVVGYADNQKQVDDAVKKAKRGKRVTLDGVTDIPTDFAVGNKIRVNGRFARVSGSGFNISDGLLEYAGHETVETAPPAKE